MEPYQKTFIELAIKHQALKFGEFTLKSGRKSPYFFNMGQLHTGLALKTLGECYANAIQKSKFDYQVLFGPAYKGIPLVCTTTVAMMALYNQDTPYAFNRKENKAHGEGGNIVGAALNTKVLIIDDVITAGTAMRESMELIKLSGGQVTGIMVALDRQEKGQGSQSALQEIEHSQQVPVKSIITFSDILSFIEHDSRLANIAGPMKLYREQYGV